MRIIRFTFFLALSSLQQLRDDTLKYKAWQKQNVYEGVDDSLTGIHQILCLFPHYKILLEDMQRLNKLEKQWENQKNDSQRLALGLSFLPIVKTYKKIIASILHGCNPRMTKSNSKSFLQSYGNSIKSINNNNLIQ